MAWIAPIAAAAREKEEEEERAMVEWLEGQEGGGGSYEYKVLRSSFGAFANRAKRQAALDEEARTGWELAAKLDNDRLILRRPVSMRGADSVLSPDVDPYRTQIGANLPVIVGLLIAVLLGLAAFGVAAAGGSGGIWLVIAVLGAVVLLAGVFALGVRRR
jgi:Flp pilus assembly protein TadB